MRALGRLGPSARAIRLLLAATVLLLTGFFAVPCGAHTVGVSRGEYLRVPEGLRVSLAFAQSELSLLGNEARVDHRIEVRGAGPCRAEPAKTEPRERDGVHVEVLSGISPGDQVVVEQSYLVKADIEKSGASHDH